MRKLLLVAALVAASTMSASANPFHWLFYTPHPYTTPAPTVTPKAVTITGSNGQVWSCVMNPAAALVCVVVVGITVQTIKEIRQGCTNDINAARLWMTYPCKPVARVAPVTGYFKGK